MKKQETTISKEWTLILKWSTKFKKKRGKYYKDRLNNKASKVKPKMLFIKIFCRGH